MYIYSNFKQRGTAVELYTIPYHAGVFGSYAAVALRTTERGVLIGGVVGGGFRSTSRVTVSTSGWLGLTWEDPTTPQQAYIGTLAANGSMTLTQISSLNAAAAAHTWPNWRVHAWKSDDGTPVEGLLLSARANTSECLLFTADVLCESATHNLTRSPYQRCYDIAT